MPNQELLNQVNHDIHTVEQVQKMLRGLETPGVDIEIVEIELDYIQYFLRNLKGRL
jgi:hypothetical protein